MSNAAYRMIRKTVREINNANIDAYEDEYKPSIDPFSSKERVMRMGRYGRSYEATNKPQKTGSLVSINHARRIRLMAQRRQIPLALACEQYFEAVSAAQVARDAKRRVDTKPVEKKSAIPEATEEQKAENKMATRRRVKPITPVQGVVELPKAPTKKAPRSRKPKTD